MANRIETEPLLPRRAFFAGAAALLILPAIPAMADTTIFTGQALPLVNALRAAKRKGPLVADDRLSRAAAKQAALMAANGKMGHAGFVQRMVEGGVPLPAAENVAVGQPTVAAVVDAWNKSRGHRQNMLGNYNRLGVALARDPRSANHHYWAMVLSV